MMKPLYVTAAMSLLCAIGAGCGGSPHPPAVPTVQAENLFPPPSVGEQIAFGPFDVAAGKEVQLCRTVKLSNTEQLGANRLNVKLNTGSHHFILFKARDNQSFPDQTFPCWGTVNFEDWEFLMDVNKTGGYDWQLPDGQGFVLEPHQQIMIQSHYVNATTVQTPAGGLAYLNIHEVPRSHVVHELHGMFTVNTRLAIPPRQAYSSDRNCSFSRGVYIVAMTGHFHARGTLFEVNKENATLGNMGEIYHSESWDSPVFKIFQDPLLVNGGGEEGVHFACSYYNDTDQQIGFGGHADVQEHCNLFFQYYNLQEGTQEAPLTCAEGSGGW